MTSQQTSSSAPPQKSPAQSVRGVVFNVPNQLTMARLVLAVVMFAFVALGFYMTALVLFIVAASTDWLDGYYARKYGQVTTLGRILDPFADKIIICGVFIFLVAVPQLTAVPWGLGAWMVAVIVGRELLVTALRGFLEAGGADFSAKTSGKWKMLLQCVAAGACLLYLWQDGRGDVPAWLTVTMIVALWATVALTVYSGVVYVIAAVRLARGR
jgi:CDP-diacylglycerol--glycerol-3-phosphate 3-phosphatidyltransferase